MTKPMKPELARNLLVSARENNTDLHPLFREALETVAAMTVQEDWRLVSTEQNGGLYEQERWTRLQSEWVKDA